MNPCHEIVLEEKHFVQPEIQVRIMNQLRIRAGKSPYCEKEMNDLVEMLKQQVNVLESNS